jgi:hypothetical protein
MRPWVGSTATCDGVVFLVLHPFVARQAERAFHGTASYAIAIALPNKLDIRK